MKRIVRPRTGPLVFMAVLVACLAFRADASDDPFLKLSEAYRTKDATAAAAAYASDATVEYAYDGAPKEIYRGRAEIQRSFESFFLSVDGAVPLDLNFRVKARDAEKATGIYRLALGGGEATYGTFEVTFGEGGLFTSDRSASATITDFEELPGPLVVRPNKAELDRNYYGQLSGRYRLPDGCILIVTRSVVRLFVRNSCDQSWRVLDRVSGLEWTAGDSVLPDSVITRYRFERPSGSGSAGLNVQTGREWVAAAATKAYRTTNVSFTSADGTRLAGTLYIPDGVTAAAPATVLVHGSGPQDRDGYASIMAVLADALAAEGRVVLAYDKRGSGGSQGNGDAAGFDILASDAAAAMGFLRTLPEVAPGSVGFAGSSQAGWVVAKAIADGATPADLFLLGAAGAAFTVREQNLYNTEVRMTCAGIAKPLRKIALQQQRAFFDALENKSRIPRLDALTRLAGKEPAIRDWLFPNSSGLNERDAWFTVLDPAFDPLPIWRRYRGKAVFVFSEFDDATDTLIAVKRLRGARVEVALLPGAQHLGLKAASLCDGELASRTSFADPLFEHLATFARKTDKKTGSLHR